MDAFASAIKDNAPNLVPGEMGRRDMRIIEAVYQAMNTGKRVEIAKG
jgi:predicted dehydrogenase